MTTGLKLLDALSLGPGGVQINVTEGKVTVATRYHPTVRGEGTTLLEATEKTTRKVIALHRKWESIPAQVMTSILVCIAKNETSIDYV